MASLTKVASWTTADCVNDQPGLLQLPIGHNLEISVNNANHVGNLLVCAVSTHTVQGLPCEWTIGDDACNEWRPAVINSAYPDDPLNPNSDFENGTTGWTTTNGSSLVVSTQQAYQGSQSGFLTPVSGFTTCSAISPKGNVSVGSAYTASAWVYSPNGYDAVAADVRWYNSGGSNISTTSGTVTVVPQGQWTLLQTTGTAPATATQAAIAVVLSSSPNSWDTLYMDQVILQAGTSGQSQTRTGIWVCANPRPIGKLNVAPLGQVTSQCAALVEFSVTGASNPVWFELDASDVGYNNATQSFAVTTGALTQECFIFAVGASSSVSNGFDFTASTWNDDVYVTTNNGVDSYGDIQQFLMWQTSSSSKTATFTSSSTTNMSAGVIAMQVTPAVPTSPNPNWPLMRFEAGFGSGIATPPSEINWTDITDRLFTVSSNRGRQYELDAVEAGEFDFVLRNNDGWLTPGNPDTPYDLRVYTPIRLVAYWDGREYSVFGGFMERWPQTWANANFGLVPAIGVDGWATLTGTLPTTLRGEILADKPAQYWPLGDPEGSTQGANISGTSQAALVSTPGTHGTSGVTVAFGSDEVLYGDGTAWQVSGVTVMSQGYALVYDGDSLPPLDRGVTIFMIAQLGQPQPSGTDNMATIMAITGPGGIIVEMYLKQTGEQIFVDCYNADGTITTANSTNGFDGVDDAFIVYISTTGLDVWYSSINIIHVTGLNLPSSWSHVSFAGRYDIFHNYHFGNFAFKHIAIIPRIVIPWRRYSYQFAAWFNSDNDYIDWRIARMLSYTTWAGARRIQYSPSYKLSDLDYIDGEAAANAITGPSNTNADLMYIDRRGFLVNRTRGNATLRPIQGVLGQLTGSGEIPYNSDVALDFDPQYVYNRVEIQQYVDADVEGSIITASNGTSVDDYGERVLGGTSYANSIFEVINLASWLLNNYAQPRMRVEKVTINLIANPGLFADVLALDVGDRLTAKRQPIGAEPISLDVVVIGVNHEIAFQDGKWNVALTISPAVTLGAAANVLKCNDAVQGVLNDGNVIGW